MLPESDVKNKKKVYASKIEALGKNAGKKV